MRSITKYVAIFGERRKLPRIELELVLQESTITFSPSLQEVQDMITSVINEVGEAIFIASRLSLRSSKPKNLDYFGR